MRLRAGIGTALVALVLTGLPVAAVSATGSASEERTRGAGNASERGQERRSERAEAALAAARDLFGGSRPRDDVRSRSHGAPYGAPHDERHASLVLRDLAVSVEALAPADREWAERLLARPTSTGGSQGELPGKYEAGASTDHTCGDSRPDGAFCLHWVDDPSSDHAPPLTDSDGDGVPDWIETNHDVVDQVWRHVVDGLGYRPPVDDSGVQGHGPGPGLDIYLAELGPDFYGYCAAEPLGSGTTAPAYCVIDNDFTEFGGDPLEILQATAAHEFFHTVQLAYTMYADVWVAEGTAAWVEDEVFDDVNDNLQYLWLGPLRYPDVPLDLAPDPNVYGWEHFNWRYGSWIWWRFLSEHLGPGKSDDPRVVRELWERLAVGQASLPALRNTLSARDADFGRLFADFGAVNRFATKWYSEGRTYRNAPVSQRLVLTGAKRSTGWRKRVLDHLSTQHVLVRPGRGLTGKWRARVELDLPPRVRGSRATVVINRKDGRRVMRSVRLNTVGNARLVVSFGKRAIASVAISLTNASLRMAACGDPASPFSCGGWSRDDALAYAYRVTAVR